MIEIFSLSPKRNSSSCYFNSNSTSTPCRSRPIQFTFTLMNCMGAGVSSLNFAQPWWMRRAWRQSRRVKHSKLHNSGLMFFFQTEKYCEVQRKRGMKAVFSLLPSFICTQSAGLAWVCRERIDAAFYSPNALLHLWQHDSVMMDQRETHTASLMHPSATVSEKSQ